MADIRITCNRSNIHLVDYNKSAARIFTDTQHSCSIYGKESTYCIVRNGEDAIAAIGYASYIESDSMQATLSHILSSFDESLIGDLKKKLIGQYVLLIKKGNHIYLFSDFIGARNIFYSDDGSVVSSSFSEVEDLIQTGSNDLDMYKVLEFLAVKHVLYPAWLGRSTENKRIKWLLPYEYLVIDTAKPDFRIGSIVYKIDNNKQPDCPQLANELLSTLIAIIGRKEYKDSLVAASLTGGRDSRLVAAIAADQYPDIHYRSAVSAAKYNSLRDLDVAKKVSRIRKVPLDIYQFQPGRDEARFRELTEGFAPSYNHSITPLIDSVGAYSLGLGGVFGTEMFMPIPWSSIDEFVQAKIAGAKHALRVEDSFWKSFREALYEELQRTKDHFQLSYSDERDYIRLFLLLDTARYGSFILSAFNREGYQLEPYGCYPVLDLALRVAPALWGNHRRLGGDALVQKTAMAILDHRLAKIMTYGSLRPMMPLSITSAPFYLMGFIQHVTFWLKNKFVGIKTEPTRTDLPGGYYISDGWEKQYLDRTVDKYGLQISLISDK